MRCFRPSGKARCRRKNAALSITPSACSNISLLFAFRYALGQWSTRAVSHLPQGFYDAASALGGAATARTRRGARSRLGGPLPGALRDRRPIARASSCSEPVGAGSAFFEVRFPQELLDISRCAKLVEKWPQFDTLIVDEAQDHDAIWHEEIPSKPSVRPSARPSAMISM